MTPDTAVTITPGHLAGPGDADAAFTTFLDDCRSWNLYRPNGETSVAVHQSLTAAIELDHETKRGPRWTIASYESPVAQLDWQARFCTQTPVEIVMAVAHRLTAGLGAFSTNVRDDLLWGRHPRDEAIRYSLEAADQPWLKPDPFEYGFDRADLTGGIRTPVFGVEPPALVAAVTVWGGPRGYDNARWKAEFTRGTPTELITAALDEVVEPLAATRLLGQVPAPNRTQVRVEPLHPRRAAAAARGRHANPAAAAPSSATHAPAGSSKAGRSL
ncbi:DUF317 domain-containing protein [Kitasatospora sp. NPDC059973]|uniref:DUF317 domain-containing protein n=1 Tax=Kitasatospora sp. NPDC059973 TaxID=3347020 RepID=UPI0036A61039